MARDVTGRCEKCHQPQCLVCEKCKGGVCFFCSSQQHGSYGLQHFISKKKIYELCIHCNKNLQAKDEDNPSPKTDSSSDDDDDDHKPPTDPKPKSCPKFVTSQCIKHAPSTSSQGAIPKVKKSPEDSSHKQDEVNQPDASNEIPDLETLNGEVEQPEATIQTNENPRKYHYLDGSLYCNKSKEEEEKAHEKKMEENRKKFGSFLWKARRPVKEEGAIQNQTVEENRYPRWRFLQKLSASTSEEKSSDQKVNEKIEEFDILGDNVMTRGMYLLSTDANPFDAPLSASIHVENPSSYSLLRSAHRVQWFPPLKNFWKIKQFWEDLCKGIGRK